MQNSTVNNGMSLFPIPFELLDEIGLDPMDVIQMSVVDGKLIIEKAVDGDFECDGECDECPFSDIECNNDCEGCPCVSECDNDNSDEEMTLYDFINSLSEQQQRAALVHLSVKWAEKESSDLSE